MKNQIIVKENKQGKKLLFNVHVYEFLCFYYSRSRTQPQSSARLGSGSSQKSSAPVLNKLPKSLKKKLFLFPGSRRIRYPSQVFYIMYNIWQDAGIRTRVASSAMFKDIYVYVQAFLACSMTPFSSRRFL